MADRDAIMRDLIDAAVEYAIDSCAEYCVHSKDPADICPMNDPRIRAAREFIDAQESPTLDGSTHV